jgi:hypothetical protein
MGYYDDPYGDYEPTEEDHCAMGGHPLGLDPQDPESGWHTCFCRINVKPIFDEPHDEFSALHANLRDEYVNLVVRPNASEFTVRTVANSREALVFNLQRALFQLSVTELQELIALTKDSNPAYLDPTTSVTTLLVIGTHLDRNGNSIISSVIRELIRDDRDKNDLRNRLWISSDNYADSLANPEHRRLARIAAKLYSKLIGPIANYSYEDQKENAEALKDICGPLSKMPERINDVAALINGKGISPATTQLVLALLSDEIEAAPAGISSGIL